MKMVEIFKTNVPAAEQARILIRQLKQLFPDSRVNFDLDDCDRILRIETAAAIDASLVANWMQSAGYDAHVLPG